MEKLLTGEQQFLFVLDDPAGNSYLQVTYKKKAKCRYLGIVCRYNETYQQVLFGKYLTLVAQRQMSYDVLDFQLQA